eukprot:TRINITY_DN30623_c1_g1_i1.p1 TRINITY_DN30623_c1_g1~~TRINITY_DN30623_c1_g1_i1.p1  ORF type:complete len:125 (+),score=12.27 TRINITY_DN30623_c1_g1_i1:39-377(+)
MVWTLMVLLELASAVTECSKYSKNGVGAVNTKADCATACKTGEGISKKGSCNLEDFKGSAGKADCQCITSKDCNSRSTACKDPGASTASASSIPCSGLIFLTMLLTSLYASV